MRVFPTKLTRVITDVTHDFENAEPFEIGQTYRLEYQLPSSPNQKTGISLAKEGSHCGWVRVRSSQPVEDVLSWGKLCFCKVEGKGRRWQKVDLRLGLHREWQEGEAFFWVEEAMDDEDLLQG